MRFRAILYHGADECWSKSGDDLLSVLMASSVALAKERRSRNGTCDGGTVFQEGKEIMTLQNEHWVKTRTHGRNPPTSA
jgi:hypothetical protein